MLVDMLVKLYDLPDEIHGIEKLKHKEIRVVRPLALDKVKIIDYIKNTFEVNWASECERALSNQLITCFIAIKDKEIVGFACYDTTGKGFFGPMGISKECRGMGVGKVLLLRGLLAMREEGYGYAIIGGASDAIEFYKKAVGAEIIQNSYPGIYSRMIAGEFNRS